MSHWIDYEMLVAEIKFHRDAAQRLIKSYKEQGKPFPDRLEYQEAVGQEIALAILESWCNDFKFSTNDVIKMDR